MKITMIVMTLVCLACSCGRSMDDDASLQSDDGGDGRCIVYATGYRACG